MDILYIDTETRSFCDLEIYGSINYSLDPTTEVIVFGYAFNDEPACVINYLSTFNDLPERVKNHIGPIVCHNVNFDKNIIKNVLKANEHFSSISNYIDTMSLCYRYNLPGSLDKASTALGFDKKDPEGNKLINKYSKPDRKKILKEIPEDDLNKFNKYCMSDIDLMRKIHKILPPLCAYENKIYKLDQKINEYGIAIDTKALHIILESYNNYVTLAEKRAEELLGRNQRNTLSIMSVNDFKESVKLLGYDIPNAQASTLEDLYDELQLKKESFLDRIKEILFLRLLLNSKGSKKLLKINDLLTGNVIYNQLQYYGATATGRWAGRGIQPQNFVRNSIKAEKYLDTLEEIKNNKNDYLKGIETISLLLRGLIVPHDENKLMIGDLSAIEARIAFWIAGCKRGLQEFREHDIDKNIPDIYVRFANKLPLQHIENPKDRRNIGKISILGLGFGMGHLKFTRELIKRGISADEKFSKNIVYTYRGTYSEVQNAWNDIQNAWINCIRYGKAKFNNIIFYRTKQTLRIRLLSGRELIYFNPTIDSYIHPKTGIKKIYGGILFENIVQATARDIVSEMMISLDELNIPISMSEHDKILAESNIENLDDNFKTFTKIMHTPPHWASDLPIAAECYISDRFG